MVRDGGGGAYSGRNRESMCRYSFTIDKIVFGIIGIEELIEREERGIMMSKISEEEGDRTI